MLGSGPMNKILNTPYSWTFTKLLCLQGRKRSNFPIYSEILESFSRWLSSYPREAQFNAEVIIKNWRKDSNTLRKLSQQLKTKLEERNINPISID
jgi:hypothetical protein